MTSTKRSRPLAVPCGSLLRNYTWIFYDGVPSRKSRRARVALARKILTISWYMVKKNDAYQQRFPVEKKIILSSARIPMRGDLVI